MAIGIVLNEVTVKNRNLTEREIHDSPHSYEQMLLRFFDLRTYIGVDAELTNVEQWRHKYALHP